MLKSRHELLNLLAAFRGKRSVTADDIADADALLADWPGSSPMVDPVFEHDCDQCLFIGHYRGHDLYRCPQGGTVVTIVARYGNEGPDYTSGRRVKVHDLMLEIVR